MKYKDYLALPEISEMTDEQIKFATKFLMERFVIGKDPETVSRDVGMKLWNLTEEHNLRKTNKHT